MCGIAGFAGPDHPEQMDRMLRAMVCSMARRGPDSEGIEKWPGVSLGHRRLAILDLSEAGRQPMLSEDRSIGVVFNGCIYNFGELRKELEALGHAFFSQCDTEVLLRGYQQWGMDGVTPRLRGMFAFAVWDDKRQLLSLARDRLGVKPLIYFSSLGRFGFASTVSALKKAGLGEGVDPQAALEFLNFGYVTQERTIFQTLHKLPAASILQWQPGGECSVRQYWSLPEIDERSPITFDEAVEETERLLIESVRLRLISDVKIGALLSGGIDSTLVCWAMAKLNANVTTFTVATPGDVENEAPEGIETARLLGLEHEVVSLPSEEHAVLDDLTNAYDEPFGCASATAMLQVSKAVKPKATVLLTGDGGDDVFLGYPFHRDYLRAQQIARSLPALTGPLWRAVRPLVNAVPQLRRPKHFADYITGGLGAITRVQGQLSFYLSNDLFGERLASHQLFQHEIPLAPARDLMSKFLSYQQHMWFASEFLAKVDGATMWHSLEARSPFLDHTLWEFAARLPPQLRLRNGVLKAILREIVGKRVSPEVAFRKKQGFSIPVERWILKQWSGSLRELGNNSHLVSEGWIKGPALKQTIDRAFREKQAAMGLWFLLVFERWLRS